MKVRIYDYLPNEARQIRKKVFMEEQGFQDEFDNLDEIALHIVLFEDDRPVGTCRIYDSSEKNCYVIGRIAVNKEFRGKSYGGKLVAAAEQEIQKRQGTAVGLSAQERVAVFYKKQGYRVSGEVYLEEGCPHIWMKKTLEIRGKADET